jgi:hypothetical protein
MPKRSSKPPRLGRSILGGVAPNAEPEPKKEKNPATVALGRLGGLKGGKARAAKLTPAKCTAIAKMAAAKWWADRQK